MDAFADLENHLKSNPNDTHALVDQMAAGYHAMKGAHAEALADLDKAIEIDPKNSAAFAARGIIHLRKGALSQAAENYNKAIRLDPSDFDSRYRRGFIFYKLKAYDLASEDFDDAIRLAPEDPANCYAYMMRGWLRANCSVETLRDAKDAMNWRTRRASSPTGGWKLSDEPSRCASRAGGLNGAIQTS